MARTRGLLPQLSAGFFSLSPKACGPDRSSYSPAVQNKIVYAGVANTSFAKASENLLEVGDLAVSAKQVERVAKGIGLERTAERNEAVAAYRDLPLVKRKAAPQGVTPPSVAVVGTDGGRIQILDRGADAAGGVGRTPRGGQGNASTQGGGQDADLPGKQSEPDALRRVPPPGTADHFQLCGERRQAV